MKARLGSTIVGISMSESASVDRTLFDLFFVTFLFLRFSWRKSVLPKPKLGGNMKMMLMFAPIAN